MDKDKNIHHGGSGTSYKGAEILKFLIPSFILPYLIKKSLNYVLKMKISHSIT